MSSTDDPQPVIQEQLSSLFGSFRAEWLREEIFDLFTEPTYLPELTTARPCALIGGRGTGKTTVLRCMSYEGQFVLRGRNPDSLRLWPYFGFYYRVNTNRVTAFRGPELTDDKWIRVFAHYLNLVMCDLVLRFLSWYEITGRTVPEITAVACRRVSAGLNLPEAHDYKELARLVAIAQTDLEARINNVGDSHSWRLSLQGAPVDELLESLQHSPTFEGRRFFFLVDEYENFADYQQQVVNTLIKHASNYAFKIGVRDLGWRRRTTLNPNEQLISPSDYVRIHIGDTLKDGVFSEFAAKVCNGRLARLTGGEGAPSRVETLFPGMTIEEEATALGGAGESKLAEAAVRMREAGIADSEHGELTPLERYFLCFWADAQKTLLPTVWDDYQRNRPEWDTRFENYKYALLFTLRRGKRGLRKYYCGWKTLTELAAGNIRYLLELVVQGLLMHVSRGATLELSVPADVQTLAAQAVGRKNLAELEGLSVHGAQLTKLLLGLGRIFQTMAADVAGHTPEVNQFQLRADQPGSSAVRLGDTEVNVEELLRGAVMHLALLRFPGSKLADEGDTRDYDYMVHPVFAAFFEFSHRRKRKLTISAADIASLVLAPRSGIRKILATHHRNEDDPLPEQLLLFEKYYRGTS